MSWFGRTLRRCYSFALAPSLSHRVNFTPSTIEAERERMLQKMASPVAFQNFLNEMRLLALDGLGKTHMTMSESSKIRKNSKRLWSKMPSKKKAKYRKMAANASITSVPLNRLIEEDIYQPPSAMRDDSGDGMDFQSTSMSCSSMDTERGGGRGRPRLTQSKMRRNWLGGRGKPRKRLQHVRGLRRSKRLQQKAQAQAQAQVPHVAQEQQAWSFARAHSHSPTHGMRRAHSLEPTALIMPMDVDEQSAETLPELRQVAMPVEFRVMRTYPESQVRSHSRSHSPSHSHSQSRSHPHVHAHNHEHSHAPSQSHHSHSQSHHSHSQSHHSHAQSQPQPQSQSHHSHSQSQPQPQPQSQSQPQPHSKSQSHSKSHTKSHSHTRSKPHSRPHRKSHHSHTQSHHSHSQSRPQSHTESHSHSQSRPQSHSDSQSQSQSKSRPHSQSLPDSQSDHSRKRSHSVTGCSTSASSRPQDDSSFLQPELLMEYIYLCKSQEEEQEQQAQQHKNHKRVKWEEQRN